MARQKLNYNHIYPTKDYSVDELCSMFISAGYERNTGWGRDIFARKSRVANLSYVIFRFDIRGDDTVIDNGCYYLALIGMDKESREVEILLKLFVRGRTIEKAESRLIALYTSKEYSYSEVPPEFDDQFFDCNTEKYKSISVS